MTDTQGRFGWYDLITTDLAAAKDFYTYVTGWTLTPFKEGYEMFTGQGGPVGGAETLSEHARELGARPHWVGYIMVDDVDAAVAKAASLGAKVLQGAFDIPDVGRTAILRDPHGAVFAPFASANPGGEEPEGRKPPGHIAWHELMAGDLEEAWAFYTAVFGWTQMATMDMGEMGEYRMFAQGGVMNAPNPGPPPSWLYYINVSSLDEAVARAKERGGTLNHGPMEVPGGDRVALLTDPQGAAFALHEFVPVG